MDITEIENLLSAEAINEICTSGSNDEAVTKWTMFYLHDLGQLNICPFICKKIVQSYDGPFDPVQNPIEWIERAIWIAAWNVFDSNMFNEFVENVEA